MMANPKRKLLPPVEVLEEWFSYDPDSGELRWLKHPQGRKGWEGKLAGSPDKSGYSTITFQGTAYKVHRIAFKLATGLEPPQELDHRDGDRGNNRLSNLRVPDDHSDNTVSSKIRITNTSGHIGVFWHRKDRLWVAEIKRRGLRLRTTFLTREEAIAWRHRQELELHGEFGQHRRNGAPLVHKAGEERIVRRGNTSGITGVSFCNTTNRWMAQLKHSGQHLIRRFDSKEEAVAQRKAWEAERNHKPEESAA